MHRAYAVVWGPVRAQDAPEHVRLPRLDHEELVHERRHLVVRDEKLLHELVAVRHRVVMRLDVEALQGLPLRRPRRRSDVFDRELPQRLDDALRLVRGEETVLLRRREARGGGEVEAAAAEEGVHDGALARCALRGSRSIGY